MATINFTDITSNIVVDANNDVTGDGYFDNIMEAFNAHIQAQYDEGRIVGTEYATVYLGGIQTAMQQAFQFALTKGINETTAAAKEYEVLNILPVQKEKIDEEIDLLQQQDLVAQKQALLIQEQIDGFDKNFHAKMAGNFKEVLGMMANANVTDDAAYANASANMLKASNSATGTTQYT